MLLLSLCSGLTVLILAGARGINVQVKGSCLGSGRRAVGVHSEISCCFNYNKKRLCLRICVLLVYVCVYVCVFYCIVLYCIVCI